ncbi:colicin immunity domain-containing protein [Erwinia sp. HDF1-3R]|uniref:colicin immunity domain-containing protein n=1 Tax=Erwinia sp. HDF1-3R TaxID=3141543 RepID=UPI0031F49BBC
MSWISQVELGRELVNNQISAEQFSEDIIKGRRKLSEEEPNKAINWCAGELFILADCYNSDSDRTEGELSEAELRAEVKALLEQFNLL